MTAVVRHQAPGEGMVFRIDLHVHTRLGSLDSSLDPAGLVEQARQKGLDGVAVTEHYRLWSEREARAWGDGDLMVYPAAEVATQVGHVLVFGLRSFPETSDIVALAALAEAEQATIVMAHPFRGALDSRHHWLGAGTGGSEGTLVAAACKAAGHVHAVEVLNNGCTDSENRLAAELARLSGLPAVAGSDAHRAAEVGRHHTAFASMPGDSRELAALLRGGQVLPGNPGP